MTLESLGNLLAILWHFYKEGQGLDQVFPEWEEVSHNASGQGPQSQTWVLNPLGISSHVYKMWLIISLI